MAEQIFRHADCLVLTVGPGSFQEAPVDSTSVVWPFLFATDFGEASLHALPYAISFANQFGAKLVLLHVAPEVPMPEGFHWSTAADLMEMRQNARMAGLRRLEELASQNAELAVKPGFMVEFGLPGEQILQAAETLKADAIIMGLHRSAHIGTASHMPWATAYEVMCGAVCPVLTVRNSENAGTIRLSQQTVAGHVVKTGRMPLRKIIVPTDFLPASTSAMAYALVLAKTDRSRVTAVYAVDPLEYRFGPKDLQYSKKQAVWARAQDAMCQWLKANKFSDCATSVIEGEAGPAIAQFIAGKGVDLIALGTSAHRRAADCYSGRWQKRFFARPIALSSYLDPGCEPVIGHG